ncbi:MAG: hypothetical protein F6K40_18415 [Okeania sp. SIO3I5]|uniref:hypothetical protein n=1 Tax=Okeania sp. SIO3I5 TaxID=2607805 RepID=UPI0013BA6262|nr:hypothetical protein [Okeania sp. SIO3I5]NEQ38130.1 hypothetical protein [Okeania sp. SIO3I5]
MIDFELLIVESEALFLPLFNRLRQEDFPVGISEYLLAIKTIQSQVGLQDIERLKRFLCLLWVKSLEDQDIFNELFEELVKPELEKRLQDADKSSLSKVEEDSIYPPQETENLEIKYSETSSNPIFQFSSEVQQENQSQETEYSETSSNPISQFSSEVEQESQSQETKNSETKSNPISQVPSEVQQENQSQETEYSETSSNPISQVLSEVQQENKSQLNQQTNSISIRHSSSNFSLETPPIKLRFRQSYNLIPRLPITRREMTGIWRNLRLLKREGIPKDLDVQATINQFCKMGFFSSVVLQPRSKNQVKLVLLIDCEGSMSPFKLLIDSLQESIEKGGLLNQTSVFYFHNILKGYLFQKSNLTKPLPIEEILSQEAPNNCVVIVSDGGAARRTYDSERLSKTDNFIRQLSKYTYLYGWLNPVPKFQWRMTTAEDIARFIPMYSLSREGLNDLVRILLGHPFPVGVNLYG